MLIAVDIGFIIPDKVNTCKNNYFKTIDAKKDTQFQWNELSGNYDLQNEISLRVYPHWYNRPEQNSSKLTISKSIKN